MIEFIKSLFTAFGSNTKAETRIMAVITCIFFVASSMQVYAVYKSDELYYAKQERKDTLAKMVRCMDDTRMLRHLLQSTDQELQELQYKHRTQ